MADDPENLVLVYLRRIDAKVDRLAGDVRDLKVPVTSMDENMAVVSRRLDSIERRFDLVDQPH